MARRADQAALTKGVSYHQRCKRPHLRRAVIDWTVSSARHHISGKMSTRGSKAVLVVTTRQRLAGRAAPGLHKRSRAIHRSEQRGKFSGNVSDLEPSHYRLAADTDDEEHFHRRI